MKQGIIQVYTGDGKGKTTAAIGLAVRAWGRGLTVQVFQMFKAPGGSGEHLALERLNPPLPVIPLGTGRLIANQPPTQEEIDSAVEGWYQIETAVLSGGNDLIVIDELGAALNIGLLNIIDVLNTLKQKPDNLELVLTGREMPFPIVEMAGLVTEMKMVKHPYQAGVAAREGIEF